MRVRQLARTVCRGRVHSKRLRPLKPSCTILRQYPEACSLVNDLPWLVPRAKWARPRGWAPSGVQASACQKPRAACSTGQAEPIGPTRARSHQVEACEGEGRLLSVWASRGPNNDRQRPELQCSQAAQLPRQQGLPAGRRPNGGPSWKREEAGVGGFSASPRVASVPARAVEVVAYAGRCYRHPREGTTSSAAWSGS